MTGEIAHRLGGHAAIVNDVDIDPTGRLLASVSRDFTLKIYSLAAGELVQSFALGRKSLKSVCFASDRIVLVGEYWGGTLQAVQPDSLAVLRRLGAMRQRPDDDKDPSR